MQKLIILINNDMTSKKIFKMNYIVQLQYILTD